MQLSTILQLEQRRMVGNMDYNFQRNRTDKIQRVKMVEELEKAAKVFSYIEFGWRDFDRVAEISGNTLKREFGSWKNALKALSVHLKSKRIELKPKSKISISDSHLFNEMDEIWSSLGHRPSRCECERARPAYSYNTYRRRFGGWQKACLKFIEYKMGGEAISIEDASEVKLKTSNELPLQPPAQYEPSKGRNISLKLRLDVLNRDGFRYIDHVIPFSKDGKTSIQNLQTLCQDCNLGKSNDEVGLNIFKGNNEIS